MDYAMLADGDRIAVAVSGGKDSLTLLRLLHDRKQFTPIKYDLLAVHVDLGYPGYNVKDLTSHFRKIGVKYHIERVGLFKGKKTRDVSCFWCSWNRRKALFQAAYRFGCNKVALGHHKDDIIETVLLNLFFHGEISAMSAKQELFKGKIILIRPLAYVEEDMIKRFAKEQGFSKQECKCPNHDNTQRACVGEIIRGVKKICPDVKTNIFRSVRRIKEEYLL